jgi:hypothetical protein
VGNEASNGVDRNGAPDDRICIELDVVAPLASNTTVTGIGQLRLSETLSNPIFTALGADVNYNYGEWTVSVGYRHQVTGNREGEDITSRRSPCSWPPGHGASAAAPLLCAPRVEDTLTPSSNPWRARLRFAKSVIA